MPRADHTEAKVIDLVRSHIFGLVESSDAKETVLSVLRKQSQQDLAREIQRSDFKLQRTKLQVILAYVDKAFKQIRKEERELLEKTAVTIDSDFEGVDGEDLMDVKDTNVLNKSVVGLWNIPSATVSEEQSPQPEKTPSEKPQPEKKEEKSSKKRDRNEAKEGSSRSKRQRDKEDRKPASSITLNDLGGIDDVISQVLEVIVMPMARYDIYEHIGADIPRGVLLYGPPGCGKTMLANAIANELSMPFISVSAPSVVSGMSGESEKKLRDIFDEAKQLAPCIIFLDEIDAITPKRENVQREMERRIVAQLLTCMDSIAMEQTGGKPVMVIGATNRPHSIDAALRRGGRFDAEISMKVPDQVAREQILRTITSKLKLEGDFDFRRLAKATPGYVGADLKALVAASGARAIRRIFHDELEALKQPEQHMGVVEDGMDVDQPPENTNGEAIRGGEVQEPPKPDNEISRFIRKHGEPLSPEELAPLAVRYEDFLEAIPTVQPSSKREGFATVPDVTWSDVGAMKPIRQELEFAIVEPIKNPEIYAQVGISAPSGVLLWGPPGCGKTLIAKAVANESKANFISVRGPELLNKFVGESERAVREVFVRARASAPCVIFFDELDALVPRRDDNNSEASSRVVNTLLTELDGVGPDRKDIYVIAATNRRDMIDPAMMRPGRLDKQLFVELPTAEERLDILKTVSRSAPLEQSLDLAIIAHDERCRNFSGADLAALTREASVSALKRALMEKKETSVLQTPVVKIEDFEAAFDKVRPSVTDKERIKYRLMNEADQS
ncbi:ribosome biogenesis ATPase Rix7p [Trichomonascus vanleenenianus]|uniref:putative AAA family ATPase RIX7 n=1 Tax=Trichomonascus vanleenenianus TaxID=2268995 RepID=UPI003EC979EC